TTAASTPDRRDGESREGPGRNAPRDQEPHRVKGFERQRVAVRHPHDRLMPHQQVDECGTHAKSDARGENARRDHNYLKNGTLFSRLMPFLELRSHDPTNPSASPPRSPLVRNSTGFSTAPQ